MTRGDGLAAALCLALLAGVYASCWSAPAPAAWVEVRAGSQLIGRFALSADRELDVQGRLGDSRILIRGGRVRFVASPCRNRLCVLSGWLWRSGDAAACLPNGVSIRLGGRAAGAIDAVSQ